MICNDCRSVDGHATCKERNANKQGADCDCLHRVRPKEIGIPTTEEQADVLPVVE